MVAVAEIALAVAVALVGASFAGVALGRVGDRALRFLTAGLALLAGAGGVLLAVAVATERWDWEPLAVVLGGLAATAAAAAGALGLSRGLRRLRSVEEEGSRVLERLGASLSSHAAVRAAELDQTLAKERAETLHLIGEQERRLRDERVAEARGQIEQARVELTDAVTESQQRLENRLRAWSGDLERAQQQLKVRLEELIRQQADALQAHEARLARHADEVAALEEEQVEAIGRLRSELERAATEAWQAMQADIETYASERRRALHEVGERLRARERSMREQIEREETELRGQLHSSLAEIERRHLEQLERLVDRASLRLAEEAERRFDVQIRDARERAAERLGRELELQLEHFARSAEQDVAARIAEAAQVTAARFQRQVDDVVRTAEAQTNVSNERIQRLTERLERSLAQAHERLTAFEATIELELATKLGEIERALRAAEQAAERERT